MANLNDVIKDIQKQRRENKTYPNGTYSLDEQGNLISNPNGDITIKGGEKKITLSSLNTELPKKLICSGCKKKLNASKDRIKKLANQNKLNSYLCRSCKSK